MAFFPSIEDPLKKKKPDLRAPLTPRVPAVATKIVAQPAPAVARPTPKPTQAAPRPVAPRPATGTATGTATAPMRPISPTPAATPAPVPTAPPPQLPPGSTGGGTQAFGGGSPNGIVGDGQAAREAEMEAKARRRAIEEGRRAPNDGRVDDLTGGDGRVDTRDRGVDAQGDDPDAITGGSNDDRFQADPVRRDRDPVQDAIDRQGGNSGDSGDIDDLVEDFVGSGLRGDEFDDVEINADPYRDVEIGYEGDSEMNDAVRQYTMGLLDPANSDTGDEEAYINQRVRDGLGAQQVEARSRMGRAGFGASGALAGIEGDQQRQANLDAEGRIYDVREREQNQAFDFGNAGAALAGRQDDRMYGRAQDDANVDFRNQDNRYGRATDEADNDFRNQTTEFGQKMDSANLDQRASQGARQDAILKAQVDAINAMMSEGEEEEDPIERARDDDGDGRTEADRSNRPVYTSDMSLEEAKKMAKEGNVFDTMFMKGLIGSDSEWDYYEGNNGEVWKVRR